MPLPLILGAAALAAGAYGAKKGSDGYQSHSGADYIVNRAKKYYARNREVFDAQEAATTSALEVLGKEELRIGQCFNEFKILADKLLYKLNAGQQDKLEINIPEYRLNSVNGYCYTAIGVLRTVAGAGIAGAATGFAIYGGVMALGAASTGTAISSLAGVAATNATLAAIGGGSLATGGLGMVGGTAILGAAVAGPMLAIAGWAYNSHGEEALNNACKIDSDVNSVVAKLKRAQKNLSDIECYSSDILSVLKSIYEQFDKHFRYLKEISDWIETSGSTQQNAQAKLAQVNDTVIYEIQNGYALAAIRVDLIMTPLFKVKYVNGEVVKDKNGVSIMETDEDGLMILNKDRLDQEIDKAKEKAARREFT